MLALNIADRLSELLAAVVFTFLGRAQNFTADRSQLIQAIDSYTPKMTGSMAPPAVCDTKHRSCDVKTLATVASTLVSRNTADLARTGIQLLNPFEPAS